MRPPNILIVMTDQQRADSVLPGHRPLMPNLDRFSAQSVSFARAFAPSPHCCPSRATFFSGQYPSRHGVWNNVCNRQALSRGLAPGVTLWSEPLARAGYDMHFCGKWHVSVEESPRDRGWTEHFVSANASEHMGLTWEDYQREPGLDGEPRGWGEILSPGYGPKRRHRLFGPAQPGDLDHDERCVETVSELLPKLGRQEKPWCTFVGLFGPHDPFTPPARFLDLYRDQEVELPATWRDPMLDQPRIYQRLRDQVFGQFSAEETREAIRHYWAYCSYIDDCFELILQSLEATGQAEETLVLFVSDHGDYCGDHGLFCKGIPAFREAYQIPALIRWPAVVKNPRQVWEFTSLADFGPTFLEAAGLPPEPGAGASLLPFLRGETPSTWRDEIHTQCNGVELYYTQRSVTTDAYKYVYNGFDFDELYDLRSDPAEMSNLAADPQYDPVKRDLCARLWRFAHAQQDAAINPYYTVALAPHGPGLAFE